VSLFLALALQDDVRARVAAVIESGRQRPGVDARWLRPERLHITVLFLGRPLPSGELAARLPALAARHGPIELGVSGAGLFATPRAPSVLWLGLQGAFDALSALRADALETYADAIDPLEHRRHYQPHLTLARGKRPGELDAIASTLNGFTIATASMSTLHLYESGGDEFTSRCAAALGVPFVAAS